MGDSCEYDDLCWSTKCTVNEDDLRRTFWATFKVKMCIWLAISQSVAILWVRLSRLYDLKVASY